MKISVIVTNYNYEKWLRRCVRSLINQNFDDYEIIIIGDCSTDKSRNILLEYQDDDKIKLIFNKSNVGVGCSSTIAAKKALGKYIVRVDADDYVHNDFLKCLYLWASFNNSHAVACGILYRTDLLEYLGYWNEKLRINEDIDMIKRFKKEFKLEYLNIPLYRYFKHEESMTHGGRD